MRVRGDGKCFKGCKQMMSARNRPGLRGWPRQQLQSLQLPPLLTDALHDRCLQPGASTTTSHWCPSARGEHVWL